MAQRLPQRLGDMRRDRRDQPDQRLPALARDGQLGFVAHLEARQMVAALHDRGDRGVEGVAPAEIVADLGDGLVHPAAHLQRRVGKPVG